VAKEVGVGGFWEIVLAKGIRVNQLAKELGVASKLVLEKLRDEGLSDKAPNHMSVLPLGLAESVREWFSSGSGGTAVETAAPVEVAVKPSRVRTSKKKKVSEPEETPGEELAAPEAAPAEEPAPAAPVSPAPEVVEVIAEAPSAPAAPSPETPAEAPAPAPEEAAPTETPAETEAAVEPATLAPAAEAPGVKPGAPSAARPPVQPAAPAPRPTITLANRPGAPVAERKPIVPAPRLVVPEPAKIQGPRVVREERPDVVPAPRPRRPLGAGPGSSTPSFTQARPQGGRGVRPGEEEDEEQKKKAAAKKGGSALSARRRGPDGRRGEAMEKLKEYTEADLIERRDRLNAASAHRTAFDSHLKKSAERGQHVQAKTGVERGEPIRLAEPITVKELSAALGVKSNEIMAKLMKQGIFANINQVLGRDVAEMIALDYGIELNIEQEQSLEEKLEEQFVQREVKPENLRTRPPVVTILGHVDHGKTSLLDKIRHANVASGEAGGITQHTAAWMVSLGEGEQAKRVTFIDTPGHQAFTSMRARGANMTDVVVLVVSAAEGVQPQTLESINHAKAAEVPLVVALNKIDRPDANPDMVLGQLAAQGLNPVEWGGETEVIRTSAVTGQGIPELIEILHYQAELLEMKADPTAPARGTTIESRRDEGLGPVATVLVQDGTLKVGDIILCGGGYGRIRSLWNDRGESIQEAGPATPVIVSGLDQLPSAGDKFYVVESLETARSIAAERQAQTRHQHLAGRSQITADNIFATMKAGEAKTINLIIKADVVGSLETLVATVTGQNTEEVKVRVIHSGVGPVTESDVDLAMATKTKPTDNRVAIIGFHVVPEESARAMAEQHHIDIKTYRVIYEIFDDLKKSLSGMLAPEIREKLHGHAEIRQVFKVSRIGNIAGCMVTDGHIQRGSKIRLTRNGTIVTEDLTIDTLKRLKDDVREVKSGFECGIKLAGYDDIKQGDIVESFEMREIPRG
jgi:translation initiation factor IF-2